MTPKTQQHLRDAWRGPMTAREIARKYHLGSVSTVQRFWQAEKAAGRLPDEARPFFRHCTATAVAAAPARALADAIDVSADLDLDLDREIGRAEAMADDGFAIQLNDPLIAALERAHAGDLRRRCDDHVFDDRQIEPSAKHCRAQRRYRDRVMTAIAKNPVRFEKAFGARA